MTPDKKLPMREKMLPFAPPDIREEEVTEVVETLRSGWITTGSKVRRFEQAFADYVGADHAVALSSCTAGLFLSLWAHGIKEGDEVITTPYTFAATANVAIHLGARPVFVDVDPDTFNLDPGRLGRAITPRTRAILPVHFAGQPCDLEPILDTARQRGVPVVEDAAHALGALYREKRIGSVGDVTCFSFHAVKNLTTGEGGMITTSDAGLAARVRVASLHGMDRSAWEREGTAGAWRYEIRFPGYKFNMSDLQAALGLPQLRRLDESQRRREEIACLYAKALGDLPGVTIPRLKIPGKHAWHIYPLLLDLEHLRIERDQFIEEMRARNISTNVHFTPVHLHRYYRETFGYKEGDFPVAEDLFRREVTLPLYPRMTDGDVNDVIEAVKSVVRWSTS